MNYESGLLPAFDDLKEFINENPWKSKESWTLIKKLSAETILQTMSSKLGETREKYFKTEYVTQKKSDKSVFVTRKGSIVGGGTNAILNALAAYLRYLEGPSRDDWQEYATNPHGGLF